MSLTRRGVLSGGAALVAGCVAPGVGDRARYRDGFESGLDQWVVEAEQPGRIVATGGVLDIDVPAGVTVWFRPLLKGPVTIDYTALAVSGGGPNDAVSDLNCFWMATDPRAPGGDVLARRRSGAFAEYDELRTYYAGIGTPPPASAATSESATTGRCCPSTTCRPRSTCLSRTGGLISA